MVGLTFMLQSEWNQRRIALQKIDQSWNPPQPPPEFYLTRSLSQRVASLETRFTSDEKCIILVGETGTGKGTLLCETFRGKRGILFVRLTGKSEVEKYHQEILVRSTGFPLQSLPAGVNPMHYLRLLLKEYQEKTGILPTLILKIQAGGDSEDIAGIGRWSKDLANDGLARVIIAISDPLVSYRLNSDPDVQNFVWVSDYNLAEATEYLDVCGFKKKVFSEMTPSERQENEIATEALEQLSEAEKKKFQTFYQKKLDYVFTHLGCRPSSLQNLVETTTKIETFIYHRILSAEDRIDDLLRGDPSRTKEWRQVLTELLSRDLSPLEVKNVVHLPSKNITPVLREYSVLTYNPEAETITWYSSTTKSAAKQYLQATKSYWDAFFRSKGGTTTGSVIAPPPALPTTATATATTTVTSTTTATQG